VLIGSSHSADTLRLKAFLARNGHPHVYLDVERDRYVDALLEHFQIALGEIPVMICKQRDHALRNPSNAEVAAALGFNTELDAGHVHDLVVVGAGPSGLAADVFSMAGAHANTGWLGGCVALDAQRFVKTGVDLTSEDMETAQWPLKRRPYQFETSLPRVFAVGDVRSGSMKRVASAVGEGSAAVQLVHKVLAE
jgi:hypothetical protein